MVGLGEPALDVVRLADHFEAHLTDEQVELAFGSLNLGDIHVEEADRVALEALSLRLIPLDVRQTGDAVPLQATVQR
jgi:hypothetical protein